jgi:hypothetical protein
LVSITTPLYVIGYGFLLFLRLLTVLSCAISSSSDDSSGPVSPATLFFGLTNLFFNYPYSMSSITTSSPASSLISPSSIASTSI